MSIVPDWPTLAAFSAASIFLAITPGPDMTLFISRALSDGRRAGIACIAGAMTGCLVHTTLVALGLSALIVASPTAFLVLKIVGAGYLLYLAIQALRHGSTLTVETGPVRKRTFFSNWAVGLGVNLLNPKVALFFMTFLPQFVSVQDPNVAGKLFFLGFLFVVLSLPIVVAIVLGAERLADWLKRNTKVMRAVDYGFAGIFSAFAIKVLLTQGR
ncbi:LysE family translocator [Rhizobium sp. EC-SD404]|uniref:LysE family translocator n=1 Tax=Rhizobium sp. EC-SD404 TaxID=2038389 RepID=UPI001254AD9B|nr:LysE family translocator [Rhizobium sp. EC-SD404]VVT00272.1 Threonine/homoserine/homoserine lactone efflux protein [Rhizobium sp. EC-SD404]